MDKGLPCVRQAMDTERQFLSLALCKEYALELFIEINPKEFFNREVFILHNVMRRMHSEKKTISMTTVYNELATPEEQKMFIDMFDPHLFADPDTLLRQFKESHRAVFMHERISHMKEMLESNNPTFDQYFHESYDYYTCSHITNDLVSMKELADYDVDDLYGLLNPRKTGIASIDKAIDAIYDGQFILIAGAPGCGKTEVGLSIAFNMPDSLFISLEMDAVELFIRQLARFSGVNSRKIRKKSLDDTDIEKIRLAKEKIKKVSTLKINDKISNIDDIISLIRQTVKRDNIKQVVIDYMQLTESSYGGNQNERFEHISRRIKNLCRELRVPIIGLSQLTKESIRENRAPILSDVRGSLAFTQDADLVMFVYVDEDEINSCSIGKYRNGEVGKITDFRYIKPIHTIL